METGTNYLFEVLEYIRDINIDRDSAEDGIAQNAIKEGVDWRRDGSIAVDGNSG